MEIMKSDALRMRLLSLLENVGAGVVISLQPENTARAFLRIKEKMCPYQLPPTLTLDSRLEKHEE